MPLQLWRHKRNQESLQWMVSLHCYFTSVLVFSPLLLHFIQSPPSSVEDILLFDKQPGYRFLCMPGLRAKGLQTGIPGQGVYGVYHFPDTSSWTPSLTLLCSSLTSHPHSVMVCSQPGNPSRAGDMCLSDSWIYKACLLGDSK